MGVIRRIQHLVTIYPEDEYGLERDLSPVEIENRAFVPPSQPGLWGGRGTRGWLFSAIWLVYLGSVVQDAWKVENPTRRVLGLVLIAVFVAVYIAVFLVARKRRWLSSALVPVRQQVLILGTMLAITTATCFAIGQSGTAMLVYDAVTGMLVMSTRDGWIWVVMLIGANEIVGRVVPGWSPDEGLSFSIFLAALAIWGITQMIYRNRQLAMAQDEIARMAVNAERTRFARDLHDLLGHSLTVITVKAELAGRLISIDPARAEQEINDVERMARDALADVRAAVAGYREVSLAAELVSARTALSAAGIEAELPGGLEDVPGDRRELFGWALREGVTNVIRHSGAQHCRVLLSRSAIEIVDDGRGPDCDPANEPSPGNGLVGLRERAQTAGASIMVGRVEETGGFRLRVGW